MNYVIDSNQAQYADNFTIKKLKIKSIDLMEEAGKKIFLSLKKEIKQEDKILIVCGSGGNGGDGYVLARYLYDNKYNVSVFITSEAKKEETIKNFKKFKGRIVNNLKDTYDVIVDAIYGVGFDYELTNEMTQIINTLNKKKSLKVSIDVPSGLNSSNGEVKKVAFKANIIYTIQFLKLGFYLGDGQRYFEKISLIDIGIKSDKISEFCRVFDKKDYKNLVSKRDKISNKGTYGRCAIIGGCLNFSGAPILSEHALSILRVGAGYSTLCIPDKLYKLYALKNLENTYVLLNSNDDGNIIFDQNKINSLLKYDAIAIGMGLGVSKEVYKTIEYLLNNYKGRLLIDADGLNSLAKYGVDILKKHQCDVILTPHILEFARLINNKNTKDVIYNSLSLVKEFSKKYNVYLVLKSNTSLICKNEDVILNINGNPCLAKGGSGDVLSGIILGLIPKTNDLLKSIAFGCYILGRSADLCVEKIHENSVLASDVIKKISDTLKEI